MQFCSCWALKGTPNWPKLSERSQKGVLTRLHSRPIEMRDHQFFWQKTDKKPTKNEILPSMWPVHIRALGDKIGSYFYI